MKYLIFTMFFSTLVFAHPPCTRHPLCDDLNDKSLECSEKWDEKTCNAFVDLFEKLLVKQECNEPGKEILWALNSCPFKDGNMPTDLHYDRLGRLPYKKAIRLYSSPKIRATMDGMVGEMHRKRSEASLKTKASPMIQECREFDEVLFTQVKGKDAHEEAKVGDYVLWDGDVPKKIVNSKTKKECLVKIAFIDRVSKVAGHDIVRYQSSEGNGNRSDAFVDLKTCKKIWEATWSAAETISGESAHIIRTNEISKSTWKKCAPCWNKDVEGCLRVF